MMKIEDIDYVMLGVDGQEFEFMHVDVVCGVGWGRAGRLCLSVGILM